MSLCPLARPFLPIFQTNGAANERNRGQIQDSVKLAICAIMSVVDVDGYFGG